MTVKYVLIGHRGVGKSELYRRMQYYLSGQGYDFYDLDVELESKAMKTITDIFTEHGEKYFRDLERQIYFELSQKTKNQNVVISTGAGFDVSIIEREAYVLWVRRKTDMDGRIFLDRPRLNPVDSPLQEFKNRAELRQKSFQAHASHVYLMPEGELSFHQAAQEIEKKILFSTYNDVGGCVTVVPDYFNSEYTWNRFVKRFANKNVEYFEIRDDLLSYEQIQKVICDLSNEKIIFSLRSPDVAQKTFITTDEFKKWIANGILVDWAMELKDSGFLADIVPREQLIVSCHSSEWKNLVTYEKIAAYLKAAPLVESFGDVISLFDWHCENPQSRSVLPWSHNGRWVWFRQYMKFRQKINFWREGAGMNHDQPTLFEWLASYPQPQVFAAILGDPVYHSYTPIEQGEFFHQKKMSIYAVQVSENEWSLAWPFLERLGLRYAAVTSPLKKLAARMSKHDAALTSINTLCRQKGDDIWVGTSTDESGFKILAEGLEMVSPLQENIVVWGGGGVLPSIQKTFPRAKFFSSRTGELREENKNTEVDSTYEPKIIIWGAPRSEGTRFPPPHWRPQMIVDLSYKEDSLGKEYAQKLGIAYISGFKMFFEQAQQQRKFWKGF